MTERVQPKSGYIGGEAASIIAMDVGNGTPPDKSKLQYGPAELEFRKGVQERFDAYREAHPDAVMDVKE